MESLCIKRECRKLFRFHDRLIPFLLFACLIPAPASRYHGIGVPLPGRSSPMVSHLGRTLMWLGAALFLAGALLYFFPKMPLRLGRLPGDIVIRGKSSVYYFPLMTSLLLSLVFSILLWLFRKR